MRRALILAGALGFVAVALGAFGAHGLKPYLAGRHDAERAAYLLDVWETGCDYALAHALALLALASLRARLASKALTAATWLFLAGSAVFSGTLWLLVLTDLRWLGAITPLGGLLLLAGWIACALGAGTSPAPGVDP
ncbi:MAG: DUF423 domain-containing protein [Planctomycetota bacterium]